MINKRYYVDKILICIDCSTKILVPRNSGRKRCNDCNKINSRIKSRNYARIHAFENREENNRKSRQIRLEQPERNILTRTKTRAKQNNIPFNLELSDIIIPEICPILKTPFIRNTEYTASLDRIIPELGYVKGNVQIISWKANAMKNSASIDELIKFADWILSIKEGKEPKVFEVKGEVIDDE